MASGGLKVGINVSVLVGPGSIVAACAPLSLFVAVEASDVAGVGRCVVATAWVMGYEEGGQG